MDTPHYSIPARLLFSVALSLLAGAPRSFRRDAQDCLGRLRPPLRVLGAENIPHGGPILLTFNHYYRPGFDAWWMALALAAAVPADLHFVMTAELTYPGKWYAFLGRPLSRWLLGRLARVYGFSLMPPMPPRPQDLERRAAAVRRTLAYARAHPQAVLAIAPEGGDQPGGLLSLPPSGSGRFLEQLARRGFRLLPAGICEQEGQLCLNFGPAYALTLPPGLSPEERERAAARQVMQHIAARLPDRLRGEFATRAA